MLHLSRKPQILRLHQLQQHQRNRYISQFCSVGQQWLPNSLWPILPILSDIYYSYTTICLCRRRLGQQYTYVTMYNQKHYEQQGVLVNSQTRTLMFVLQITQRHLVKYLLKKLFKVLEEKVEEGGKWKLLRDFVGFGVEGVLEQGRLLMLMLFLLGWNKYFNVVDTIVRNRYIYTYKNKNSTFIDYRVQGYLLLVVFIVKFIKFSISIYKNLNQKKIKPKNNKLANIQEENSQKNNQQQQEQLCRICYDQIKDKSVTNCGHVFCWQCILKYLLTHPQCPVCRASCEPRQIIQLQNF